jgi:hypothetical protein
MMGYWEDCDRFLIEFCKNSRDSYVWEKVERICSWHIEKICNKFDDFTEEDIDEIKCKFFPDKILEKICPKICSIEKKWSYLLKCIHTFIIDYSKKKIRTISLDSLLLDSEGEEITIHDIIRKEDVKFAKVIFKYANRELLTFIDNFYTQNFLHRKHIATLLLFGGFAGIEDDINIMGITYDEAKDIIEGRWSEYKNILRWLMVVFEKCFTTKKELSAKEVAKILNQEEIKKELNINEIDEINENLINQWVSRGRYTLVSEYQKYLGEPSPRKKLKRKV